jgi:predicted RNA binding protein YcfA (HicA-like mRNA interferase family)
LRPVEARKLVRVLASIGYRRVSQSGSHLKLRHADGRILVVPMHANQPVNVGLLRAILRQAGLTVDQFHLLL